MIAILDYGSGNLRSAARACERSGADVVVTSDPEVALNAQGLLVPGVGAFGACMSGLRAISGDEIVRRRIDMERPVLGICVGMQILFSQGEENSTTQSLSGVGVLDGEVTKLNAPILPHMGWNNVEVGNGSNLFKGIEGESFYFVHSYGVKTSTSGIRSWSTYGERFLAAIESGYISATQFHPEKSGAAGLHLMKNWVASL